MAIRNHKLLTHCSILVLLYVLILELPSVVSSRQFSISQIKAKWSKGECPWKDSTLCFNDSPDLVSSGVSKKDQKLIVDVHNEYRGKASPPAADLMVLIWDDKIAAVAQKLANQCELYHDKNRNVPGYGVYIGQNIATGYANWKKTIDAWYKEKRRFKFGARNPMSKVGHFTQILYERTSRVGCGFAKCKKGRYYVCNYASGQLNYAFRHPYKKGKLCGDCPNNCKKGLCDCKGKLCLNNGRINPSTCKCKCGSHYEGDVCEILNCRKKDLFLCPNVWSPKFCKLYSNVPSLCPHMCGICH